MQKRTHPLPDTRALVPEWPQLHQPGEEGGSWATDRLTAADIGTLDLQPMTHYDVWGIRYGTGGPHSATDDRIPVASGNCFLVAPRLG